MNFSDAFKQTSQLCRFSPDGVYLVLCYTKPSYHFHINAVYYIIVLVSIKCFHLFIFEDGNAALHNFPIRVSYSFVHSIINGLLLLYFFYDLTASSSSSSKFNNIVIFIRCKHAKVKSS